MVLQFYDANSIFVRCRYKKFVQCTSWHCTILNESEVGINKNPAITNVTNETNVTKVTKETNLIFFYARNFFAITASLNGSSNKGLKPQMVGRVYTIVLVGSTLYCLVIVMRGLS